MCMFAFQTSHLNYELDKATKNIRKLLETENDEVILQICSAGEEEEEAEKHYNRFIKL